MNPSPCPIVLRRTPRSRASPSRPAAAAPHALRGASRGSATGSGGVLAAAVNGTKKHGGWKAATRARTLLLAGLGCWLAQFTASAVPPAPEVWLLGGQSNMQGIAKTADLPAELRQPIANAWFWNGADFEPLVPGQTPTSTRRGEFGPEIGFALALATPERPVYLVKYAASGMPLHHGWDGDRWVGGDPRPERRNFHPGTSSDDPNQGTLYRAMRQCFRQGIDRLAQTGAKPVIRGFLWMQGEQDSKQAESAGTYAASLRLLRKRLAEDLQATPELPFAFGQVLPHEPPLPRFTHRTELRAQMAAADGQSGAPQAIPNARMVSTDGCGLLADTVHYDAEGQLRLGRAFAAAMTALSAAKPAAPAPPNIVFFLADDLGQRDLGCYGSTFYETPNLDQLAKDGARFTNAYAACPVCSPTRASILTGQWPQRTGITDYIGAPLVPEQWKRNTRSLPAPYSDRLALETTTLAEALKPAGYATFFAGKWHLGPQGFWPENQGFDINMGGTDRGGPYGGKRYFSPYGNPRLPDGPPGEHLPDRLATETAKFIEANKDRRFFAYFAFYDVHTPLMARPDLQAKYTAKQRQLKLSTRWGREEPRDVRLSQDHAVYAGMVEAMDLAVGKVLAQLDALGLRDNTLVIFTSDNGGLATSEGWPTSNQPLRAGKGWVHEGGIREPLIVRWPARVKPSITIDTPVSSPDFFPTLLEATGAKPAPGQILDGMSILPVLGGGTLPERPLFWHYPHYGNQGGAPAAAVRLGRWKLIEWLEDGRSELYDVLQDTGETNNLAAKEPRQVATLRTLLHAWQKEVRAKFPVNNPAYDPAKPDGRAADRLPRAPQQR